MEQSIKCCDFFEEIRYHFNWFSYQDDNDKKVYCMPVLKGSGDSKDIRINYCPSCGKEIRGIELR